MSPTARARGERNEVKTKPSIKGSVTPSIKGSVTL